jgi:hypothetical protein
MILARRLFWISLLDNNTNIAVKILFNNLPLRIYALLSRLPQPDIVHSYSQYISCRVDCNALNSSPTHRLGSPRVRGDLLATLCFNRRQIFSIGFRSGELAGQHILSILFRSWSWFLSLTICVEAPSSMRIACLKWFVGCCVTQFVNWCTRGSSLSLCMYILCPFFCPIPSQWPPCLLLLNAEILPWMA